MKSGNQEDLIKLAEQAILPAVNWRTSTNMSLLDLSKNLASYWNISLSTSRQRIINRLESPYVWARLADPNRIIGYSKSKAEARIKQIQAFSQYLQVMQYPLSKREESFEILTRLHPDYTLQSIPLVYIDNDSLNSLEGLGDFSW